MRIIIEGKCNEYNLEQILCLASDKISDIIKEEEPELFQSIVDEVDDAYIISASVELGFKVRGQEELQSLVTEHGEVLTFKFTANGEDIELQGDNKDTPIFSDTDRAYVDLAEGLEEVEPQLDVEGLAIIYQATVAGFVVTVYENGYALYHKDGKLVQECTVPKDKIDDFLEELNWFIEEQE